jgi:D-sedoheptulose 7-phosphate isomerase
MNSNINNIFNQHLEVVKCSKEVLAPKILRACELIKNAISLEKKVLIFGNGGSAADAQHIAAEFTGRFEKERLALPAIALTTDTSALTAIGNDYGFDKIFERQVEALAKKGDILIGISTSGNSPNVLNAFKIGKSIGCISIGLSGRNGGQFDLHCDLNLIVPSEITARIQEIHILIGHIICSNIDLN